jgi:hypothetical protein
MRRIALQSKNTKGNGISKAFHEIQRSRTNRAIGLAVALLCGSPFVAVSYAFTADASASVLAAAQPTPDDLATSAALIKAIADINNVLAGVSDHVDMIMTSLHDHGVRLQDAKDKAVKSHEAVRAALQANVKVQAKLPAIVAASQARLAQAVTQDDKDELDFQLAVEALSAIAHEPGAADRNIQALAATVGQAALDRYQALYLRNLVAGTEQRAELVNAALAVMKEVAQAQKAKAQLAATRAMLDKRARSFNSDAGYGFNFDYYIPLDKAISARNLASVKKQQAENDLNKAKLALQNATKAVLDAQTTATSHLTADQAAVDKAGVDTQAAQAAYDAAAPAAKASALSVLNRAKGVLDAAKTNLSKRQNADLDAIVKAKSVLAAAPGAVSAKQTAYDAAAKNEAQQIANVKSIQDKFAIAESSENDKLSSILSLQGEWDSLRNQEGMPVAMAAPTQEAMAALALQKSADYATMQDKVKAAQDKATAAAQKLKSAPADKALQKDAADANAALASTLQGAASAKSTLDAALEAQQMIASPASSSPMVASALQSARSTPEVAALMQDAARRAALESTIPGLQATVDGAKKAYAVASDAAAAAARDLAVAMAGTDDSQKKAATKKLNDANLSKLSALQKVDDAVSKLDDTLSAAANNGVTLDELASAVPKMMLGHRKEQELAQGAGAVSATSAWREQISLPYRMPYALTTEQRDQMGKVNVGMIGAGVDEISRSAWNWFNDDFGIHSWQDHFFMPEDTKGLIAQGGADQVFSAGYDAMLDGTRINPDGTAGDPAINDGRRTKKNYNSSVGPTLLYEYPYGGLDADIVAKIAPDAKLIQSQIYGASNAGNGHRAIDWNDFVGLGHAMTTTPETVAKGINWLTKKNSISNEPLIPIFNLQLSSAYDLDRYVLVKSAGQVPTSVSGALKAALASGALVTVPGSGDEHPRYTFAADGMGPSRWPAIFAAEPWANGQIIIVGTQGRPFINWWDGIQRGPSWDDPNFNFGQANLKLQNYLVYAPGDRVESKNEGTTISAAMISAQAALVKGVNACLTAKQIAHVIFKSASHMGTGTDCVPDDRWGWGIANIEKAMQEAQKTPCGDEAPICARSAP